MGRAQIPTLTGRLIGYVVSRNAPGTKHADTISLELYLDKGKEQLIEATARDGSLLGVSLVVMSADEFERLADERAAILAWLERQEEACRATPGNEQRVRELRFNVEAIKRGFHLVGGDA